MKANVNIANNDRILIKYPSARWQNKSTEYWKFLARKRTSDAAGNLLFFTHIFNRNHAEGDGEENA